MRWASVLHHPLSSCAWLLIKNEGRMVYIVVKPNEIEVKLRDKQIFFPQKIALGYRAKR